MPKTRKLLRDSAPWRILKGAADPPCGRDPNRSSLPELCQFLWGHRLRSGTPLFRCRPCVLVWKRKVLLNFGKQAVWVDRTEWSLRLTDWLIYCAERRVIFIVLLAVLFWCNVFRLESSWWCVCVYVCSYIYGCVCVCVWMCVCACLQRQEAPFF